MAVIQELRAGYYPWRLTKQETIYLTTCLKQTLDVALRFKKDEKLLPKLSTGTCLVRVPMTKNNTVEWKDSVVELPNEFEIGGEISYHVDSKRLENMLKNNMPRRGVWEIDWFYFNSPVRDGNERPYFPKVILIVDHDSHFILNLHMLEHSEKIEKVFDGFLNSIANFNRMPFQLAVKKDELFNMLSDLAHVLGIEIEQTDRLPSLEEARDEMLHFRGFR